MLRRFATLAFIVGLVSACAGPQAFAQPTSGAVEEFTPTGPAVGTPLAPAAPVVVAALPANDNDAPGIDFTPIVNTIINWIVTTVALVIASVLTWVGAKIGFKLDGFLTKKTEQAANDAATADAQHDITKDTLIEKVIRDGFDYLMKKSGWTVDDLKDVRIKNALMRELIVWVTAQWPELVEWIDQDKDGEIDFLEQKLMNAGALPVPANSNTPPATPAAA